jgi:hypothetical protein
MDSVGYAGRDLYKEIPMQISLPLSASGWRDKTASGGGLTIGLLSGANGSAMVFGLDSKLLAMTIATPTP